MIGRTNTGGGGGGGGLNFQVVGGSTAPSNHKENMIWVNTSTTISSWVFSATQPTAATGKVWFPTDTSSTVVFNALKKNGIQVYPISAKQYVGGEWVDKTAKSWQSGAWVDWSLHIISPSVDNTGGFRYYTNGSGPTAVKNADGSYTLTRPNGNGNGWFFRTNNVYNVSTRKHLKFNITKINGVVAAIGLVPANVSNEAVNIIEKGVAFIEKPTVGSYDIQLNGVNVECVFAVNLAMSGGNSCTIANVRCE